MKKIITILLLLFTSIGYAQIKYIKVGRAFDTASVRQSISLVFTTTGSSGAATATYNNGTGIFTMNVPQYSGGTNYWTATSNDIYSNNSGNVGIGVNPPTEKLDVNGNVKIFGNISLTNPRATITTVASGVSNVLAFNSLGLTTSSGNQNSVGIFPTILQSGTAGYKVLNIGTFESTTGSGDKYLIDAGTYTLANGGGTYTSKFAVNTAGDLVNIKGVTYSWPSSSSNGVLTNTGGALSWGASGGSGTVTNVAALTLGTTGTDLSSSVANSTTTPVITLNVPTASASNRGALSSTDWSAFNSKQAAGNFFTRTGDSASYVNLPLQSILTPIPASGVTMFDSSGRWSYRTSLGKTVSFSTSLISGNSSIIDTFQNRSGILALLSDTTTFASKYGIDSARTNIYTSLAGKQATLVSGTNIKTINGSSILGSGDLVVSGGSGSGDSTFKVLKWINVRDYGALGNGTTDDTYAIQSAINAAKRSTDSAYNAIIYFPYTGSDYIVNGAIRITDSSSHTVNSAQLYIPVSPFGSPQNFGTIKLMGSVSPNLYTDYSTGQTGVPSHMVTIRSTSTSSTGSVLGTAYTGGAYGNWNFTQFMMENICIRVRSKTAGGTDTIPTMTAFDATQLGMVDIKNSRFDTQSPQTSSSQPAITANGIVLPANGNFVFVKLDNVLVQNFYNGITVSECSNLNQVFITTCYNALKINTGYHTVHLTQVFASWCYNNIFVNGTARVLGNIDFENYPSSLAVKWFNHNLDYYEPSLTNSQGVIKYTRITAATGYAETTLDSSATKSPLLYMFVAGQPLFGLKKTVSAFSEDYFDLLAPNTSTNPYTIVNLNRPSATGSSMFLFQRNSLSRWAITNGLNNERDFSLFNYKLNASSMYIDSLGNVGLGGSNSVTTPTLLLRPASIHSYFVDTLEAASATPLYVKGTSGNTRIAINNTSGSNNVGISLLENSALKWSIASYAGGKFTFYNEAAGNEGLGMDASSNAEFTQKLSVGYSTPQTTYQLDVAGTLRNTTSAAFATSSGNVGIGTTGASSTLHVNGSFATAYVAKTATYSASATDNIIECTSGTFTVTLPTAVGITGREYWITNTGSGTITIGTTSSQTFVNVATTPTTLTVAQFTNYRAVSNGANWLAYKIVNDMGLFVILVCLPTLLFSRKKATVIPFDNFKKAA